MLAAFNSEAALRYVVCIHIRHACVKGEGKGLCVGR